MSGPSSARVQEWSRQEERPRLGKIQHRRSIAAPDADVLRVDVAGLESLRSGAEAADEAEGAAQAARDVDGDDLVVAVGLDLLEQLENITFETVFVTAFSNYAIKALNLSASYYLLKPIDIDELVKAVEKISQSVSNNKMLNHTKILINNIKIENKQLQKIVLPLIDGFEVVQVNQIIRCEAFDNFTYIFLSTGRKLVICRTLKHFETTLADYDFLRVHKSHLINIQYIKQYKKGKGGQAIMSDGTSVDISPNRKQEFLAKFS